MEQTSADIKPAPESSFGSGARSALTLARPEYIPTVLSNCIAGWWLGGGGGNGNHLVIVLVGTLLMFLGGAFLNDVFDVAFDRLHRRNRPVPSGRIGLRTLWRWGLVLLLAGTLLLQWPGRVTGALAMVLALAIVLRNTVHRLFPFSSALLGLCRVLLYMLGASIASRGVTGIAIWCGLALGIYVFGLESTRADEPHERKQWPLVAIAAPLFLAFLINKGPYFQAGLILGILALTWMVLAWGLQSQHGKSGTAPGLLVPGIVLVDMLAICPAPAAVWQIPGSAPRELSLLLGILFVASLLSVAAQTISRGPRKEERSDGRPIQGVLFR